MAASAVFIADLHNVHFMFSLLVTCVNTMAGLLAGDWVPGAMKGPGRDRRRRVPCGIGFAHTLTFTAQTCSGSVDRDTPDMLC
ncbi:hypothetical protein CFBP7129_06625 [Agrobacterium tumefaciens]|uniref:Uncharacterized protein n=1 Tax=Agrobacterium tumefaciens TaxID=358 RepID=A0A4D7YRP5_AGRTU|nr:hypothetical protein CFBP7129_06625 [Agrobacterium tumefaciens]